MTQCQSTVSSNIANIYCLWYDNHCNHITIMITGGSIFLSCRLMRHLVVACYLVKIWVACVHESHIRSCCIACTSSTCLKTAASDCQCVNVRDAMYRHTAHFQAVSSAVSKASKSKDSWHHQLCFESRQVRNQDAVEIQAALSSPPRNSSSAKLQGITGLTSG